MHESVTFVGNCNIKENEDGEEIVPRKIKVAVIDDGFTLVNNLDDFSKNEIYGASCQTSGSKNRNFSQRAAMAL